LIEDIDKLCVRVGCHYEASDVALMPNYIGNCFGFLATGACAVRNNVM